MALSTCAPIIELRQRIAAPMSPATIDTGLMSLVCPQGHGYHVVAMISTMYEDKRGLVEFVHHMLEHEQVCAQCGENGEATEVWLATWLPSERADVIVHLRGANSTASLSLWTPGTIATPIEIDDPILDELPPALATRRAILTEEDDLGASLEQIEAVLGRWPTYTPALKARARLLKAMRRHEEARVAIEQSLDVEPTDAEAWFFLGDILDEILEIDLAIHAYNCSLALDPANADAHNQRAILLRRNGRIDDAVEGYRAGLVIAPHHPSTLNNLAIIHHQRDEAAEVCALLERVRPSDLEHEPVVPGLFSLASECGVRRARLEDMRMARRFFELACGFRENVASAWYNWAMSLAESGCLSEAIVKLRRALELDGELHDARDMLSQCEEVVNLTDPYGGPIGDRTRHTLHYVDARGRERRLLNFTVDVETTGCFYLRAAHALNLDNDRDLLCLLAAKAHNHRVAQGLEGRRIIFVCEVDPTPSFLQLAGALEIETLSGRRQASAVAPIYRRLDDAPPPGTELTRPSPMTAVPRAIALEENSFGDVCFDELRPAD